MTTPQTIEGARRMLQTLEREAAGLPARHAEALAASDLAGMRTVRSREEQIGEEVRLAGIAVARLEAEAAERELRAFRATDPHAQAQAVVLQAHQDLEQALAAFEQANMAHRNAAANALAVQNTEGALQARIQDARRRERELLDTFTQATVGARPAR